MFCKNCGKEIPDGSKVCPECGTELVEMVYCAHCGARIEKKATVCPQCGTPQGETKFCQHCGAVIDKDTVVCPKCGKQVKELKSETAQPAQVVIHNNNNNVNTNTNTVQTVYVGGKPKNKWVAFLLCFFLGVIGAHKFYEGRIGMGILYLCTLGLCGIGVLIDLIAILLKPNPYYVR